MKKTGRILSVILILALAASLFAFPAAAADAPISLVVREVTGGIEVDVVATSEIVLANYTFTLTVDNSDLTLSTISDGLAALGGVFQPNAAEGVAGKMFGDNVTIPAESVFATFAYTAASADPVYTFTLTLNTAADQDAQSLPWEGSTVTESNANVAPLALEITEADGQVRADLVFTKAAAFSNYGFTMAYDSTAFAITSATDPNGGTPQFSTATGRITNAYGNNKSFAAGDVLVSYVFSETNVVPGTSYDFNLTVDVIADQAAASLPWRYAVVSGAFTAPAVYTASFAPGEGGEGTAPESITGSNVTLPANSFTNSDATMTFVGWLSSADGRLYPAGAKVTLTEDTTFTAQWASYVLELQPNVTKVGLGGTVIVTVKNMGTDINGWDLVVTYNTEYFTYGSDATGKISLMKYDQTLTDGVVAELSFTAKSEGITETVTGAFGFEKAEVTTKVLAAENDAFIAQTTGCEVDIVPTYMVRFYNKAGTQIGDSIEVAYGYSVASVPAAPSEAHYEFTGWTEDINNTLMSADEILAAPVTASVNYTATYEAEKYTVTNNDPEEIEAPGQATYGEDYEGEVENPNPDYDYSIEVEFDNGTKKTYPVNDDGSFTIPAEDITGPFTISLQTSVAGIVVKTYMDYMGGHTLIVAYGTRDSGYSFNGSAMYRVAAYDNDAVEGKAEGAKAFAWIMKGGISDEEALTKIDLAAAAAGTITLSNFDVNATGKTDIADAQAVADCYNVEEELPVASYMALYLRADVNSSHVVDTADANAVLSYLMSH